jgi:16S rRNA (guanine527-N7)-methyltransferase
MINDIDNIDAIIPGLSSELKQDFLAFFDLISHYNAKINLISQGTIARAGSKHFADSYLGNQIVLDKINKDQSVFDFGSGNGFPGIILGLMDKNRTIVLVERDRRKAEFLKISAHSLGLKNITVLEQSVGDMIPGSCSIVISRAMAPIPKFLLEARRAVAKDGVVFLFKGTSWTREFSSCPPQIFDYWEVAPCGTYTLPVDQESRSIIECNRIE